MRDVVRLLAERRLHSRRLRLRFASGWRGLPRCHTLQYAITPASGKNLWAGAGTSENRNTWNGPIIHGADGKNHLFDPVSCAALIIALSVLLKQKTSAPCPPCVPSA
jgi:hypothetical protein